MVYSVVSGPAPVSAKPLGSNDDRGEEHERRVTEDIGSSTKAATPRTIGI